MFHLTRIAATTPSSVARMTKHLMNATLSLDQNIEATRLVQGESVELNWYRTAQAVLNGDILQSEATHDLMQPWLRTANYGDQAVFAQAEYVREQINDRLLALMDRIADGTALAPLAILRPDTEAGVERQLGIIPGMLLTGDNVNALLAGRRVDGSLIPGKTYATGGKGRSQPVGSYDFCCMAPKSLSVGWAFASPPEQARLLALHMQAAREAAAYIADEVGVARCGAQGAERIPGAVTWLEFTHHTARKVWTAADQDGAIAVKDSGLPGDPSLHTHFLFPNAVFTADGRVGSIDAYRVGGLIREAGQFYQARLGRLLRDAGYNTDVDAGHFTRLEAVPLAVERIYSKRRAYGEVLARRYTEQQGEAWEALSPAQQTARITRAVDNVYQLRKGGKDDQADFAHWRKQADTLGWQPPQSFELIGPPVRDLSNTERQQKAYEIAVQHLEPEFARRSVLSHYDLRFAALVGLTRVGVKPRDHRSERIADVDAVTRLMREQGVRQHGERTALLWATEADGGVSVTTGLHLEQETELIERLRKAHADRSLALSRRDWLYHVRQSGLDFSDEHGRSTLDAMTRAATGSRFELVEAAAGAGKTTAAASLVAARRAQHWQIHGASLAWQQADDLTEAGIHRRDVHAFSVLLDKLADGSLKFDRTTLLVVDEFGLLGTRQLLELMRYQNRDKFSIVALGDRRQLSSVEAGHVINLARTALGADNVPTIETTRRQAGREAEIVGLLRQGQAAKAIAMKREDGTAIMAQGGRTGTVETVVALYMRRLAETGLAPSIGVPTNEQAHQINVAVREALQAAGKLETGQRSFKATDGKAEYALALAAGDRVRLLRSTGGRYEDPATGRVTGGSVGRNGSVLTVRSTGHKGLRAVTAEGREVTIDWAALTDKTTGRLRLAYGYAATNHRSQGKTAGEHIWVLPEGSAKVSGAAAYSAGSRHRHRSWLVTNARAEDIAVRKERAVNDAQAITDEDRWACVAKRLSWQPEKDTATALAARTETLQRGSVALLHTVAMDQAAVTPRQTQKAAVNAAAIVQRHRLDAVWTTLHRTAAAYIQKNFHHARD